MKTVFDLNLTSNSMGNFALNLLRESLRNAIVGIYRELKDQDTNALLTGESGGIDAYNEAVGEAELEATAQDVREEQGHDRSLSLAQHCAFADACVDFLDELVEEMKTDAERDERGNIKGGALKGILYFKRTLAGEAKEVFEREWGNPTEKTLSSKLIEQEFELAQAALGRHATVQLVIDRLLAQKKRIGEKYAARFDEILHSITERAAAKRRIDCQSLETMYRTWVTRQQNGRHVRSLLTMNKSSLDRFQSMAAERGWDLTWVAMQSIGKKADIEQLTALAAELVDTSPGAVNAQPKTAMAAAMEKAAADVLAA